MEKNHFYARKTEEVLKEFSTSRKGLSSGDVSSRLATYGPNELQRGKKDPLTIIFLRQFKDFLMYLLLAATALSALLGEYLDASAMFAIAILSAILGFVQEYKSGRAIEALQKLAAPHAKAIRDSSKQVIEAKSIVPGDIVLLEAGDIVPADIRLMEASSLRIEEAALTGESVPRQKDAKEHKQQAQISEQNCMAFMSTNVVRGGGMGVVVATGMRTEIGKIAASLQETKEAVAPLQVKFKEMSKQIGYAVIIIIVSVFMLSIFTRDPSLAVSQMIGPLLIFTLSLAAAAVPSSLPAIVTISLSMGAKLLATKKMIIKKLPAAESLGEVTIICSDKTGTLTKNEMTVVRAYASHAVIDVSGAGYAPEGALTEKGSPVQREKVEMLLRISALCNNAQLTLADGKYGIVGDPTEGALVVLAQKGGLNGQLHERFERVKELPFDSERKCMSVICRDSRKGGLEAYVKGATDILLEHCTKILINGKVRALTAKDKKGILGMNERFAQEALRVLGCAYKPLEGKGLSDKPETIESNLVFAGMVGMSDPPRPEVREAVQKCRNAGIRVMIITGDHALTTRAVGESIGLVGKNDLILAGAELDKMGDEMLEKDVESIRIVARALPQHKLRIVNALQKRGHIVAMTGDGVNDAPALKKADIGIAMGATGTDVAKEVSKGILVDDNFATIVNAVEEGRNIYDKIIKSTRYLLCCNAGEVIIVLSAVLMHFPFPLLPLQILMMNLVTDGLPALALTAEGEDGDILKRPPRDPKEMPINGKMLSLILIFGTIMGIGSFILFRHSYITTQDLAYAQTVAFTTLVMYEMFAVLGSRSFISFEKLNPLTNKMLLLAVLSSIGLQLLIVYWGPFQQVFHTVPLAWPDWQKILLLSSSGFFLMELSKFFVHGTAKKVAV